MTPAPQQVAHLAGLKPDAMALAADISEANNIPKKFLDAILGELRNAGVVYSRKGPGGGYRLARPAAEIRLGQVVRALDGPIAPIACARRTSYQPCQDCGDVKRCRVRLAMTKVRDAMSDILDMTTIADMLLLGNSKKTKVGRRRAAPVR